MTWQYEHGEDYDVPAAITMAEGIQDMSWHNDACPSFGQYVHGANDDTHDVRIWVEHPDVDYRETLAARFMVTYHAWSNPTVPGLEPYEDGAPIYEGDDAGEALASFMATLALVRAAVKVGAA